MKIVWESPVSSCAFIKDVEFVINLGHSCSLNFEYEDENDNIVKCEIKFLGVEAFKCTYMTSISSFQRNSYDNIVSFSDSAFLKETINEYKGNLKLIHFMCRFDDSSCFDIIASDFEIHN